MTESEIVTNELIVEAIDKIVEKFQKKAIKEREKAKRAYVTYKGEIFFTEDDLMGAYSGDVFSGSTHDKLLEKLRKAKKVADNESNSLRIELICCMRLPKIKDRKNGKNKLTMNCAGL